MGNGKTTRNSEGLVSVINSAKGEIKQLAKKVLPPIVVDMIRRLRKHDICEPSQDEVQGAECGCQVLDYETRRNEMIANAIGDQNLLESFRNNGVLPSAYGVAIDERCVEYPWVFANLRNQTEILLDAGSTLNHEGQKISG